jgi:hypothetical protein
MILRLVGIGMWSFPRDLFIASKTQNCCAVCGYFCFYALIKMNFEMQDYADACSPGFVHRKLKPKTAAQFAGIFVFMRLSK